MFLQKIFGPVEQFMPSDEKDLSFADGKEAIKEKEQPVESEAVTPEVTEGRVSPAVVGANDAKTSPKEGSKRYINL